MSQAGAVFFRASYIEVTEPGLLRASGLLRDYRAAARATTFVFEVLQRLERPTQFLVLASWAGQDDYEGHAGQAAELEKRMEPLLAAPLDTRLHNPLAVDVDEPVSDLMVATHVDVVPQHKDEAVLRLQQIAEASRGHPGNLRFHVWQQTNRANHFTGVEGWADRSAFNTHVSAPETKAFRGALTAMTGALYDERLYTELA